MKRTSLLTLLGLGLFALAACGPRISPGVVEISFNTEVEFDQIHLCQVTEWTENISHPVDEIAFDEVISNGWSADEGFPLEGTASGPGFECVLNPSWYEMATPNLENYAFLFSEVDPGKYAVVLFSPFSLESDEGLMFVRDSDNALVVFDLPSGEGIELELGTLLME